MVTRTRDANRTTRFVATGKPLRQLLMSVDIDTEKHTVTARQKSSWANSYMELCALDSASPSTPVAGSCDVQAARHYRRTSNYPGGLLKSTRPRQRDNDKPVAP